MHTERCGTAGTSGFWDKLDVGSVWGVCFEGVVLVVSVALGDVAMGQKIPVCPKEFMGWDRNWLGMKME